MKILASAAVVVESKFPTLVVHTSNITGYKVVTRLCWCCKPQQKVLRVTVEPVGSKCQSAIQKSRVNTKICLLIGFPFQAWIRRLGLRNSILIYFIKWIAKVIKPAAVYIRRV